MSELLDKYVKQTELIAKLKKKLAEQRELTKYWINEFNELENETISLSNVIRDIQKSEELKFDNFGTVDLERIKAKYVKEINNE